MVAIPIITSNGAELPAEFELTSVEVIRETNRIPIARLVFADGEIAQGVFPALDSDALAPGAEIEIAVREDDDTSTLFKGLVVRLSFDVNGGVPRLVVEVKDKAFRLTRPRRTAVYAEMSDGEAIGAVLDRAGIEAGDLGPPTGVQPALVQYDASDWDFIASRAEANGLVVVVEDGVVSLKPLVVSGAPVVIVQLGLDDIDELELEIDAADQYPGVEATGWDVAGGAATQAAAGSPLALAQGNLDPAAAGRSLGIEDARLRHFAVVPGAELKAWASARVAHSRLAMLRGRIGIGGNGSLRLMDMFGIAGAGERFAGNALVTGIRHVIEAGGWRSDLRLGLPPEGFAATPDIVNAPANGLLPPARGLHVGIVAAFEDDAEGEYRVRITLPGFDTGEGTLWARLSAPEAGSERGFFFRPDAGDEVIVGFLAEDPRQPVILGALFGSKNAPGSDYSSLSSDNITKGIATRNGVKLVITDQASPIVTLQTPAGRLTIDDDAGALTLSDGNGNSIVMNSDGVTIKSGKDLILEAAAGAKIKGATIDAN